MQKLDPSEILDRETYERERDSIRKQVFEVKRPRRVHLGQHLTLLFENADTLRYQVQEMLRIERRTKPEDVRHEVDTYNELLGGPGQLSCTLLIEVEDEAGRARKLREWLGLQEHVFVELEDGERAPAHFDPRQVGKDRVSSVQYLFFDCGDKKPHAVICDFPGLEQRVELTPEQVEALAQDLAATR